MTFDRIQLSQEMLVAAIGDSWPTSQVDAAVELLASSEGRFPAGVRKLPADLISAVQRERLIAAMLKAAAELSYRRTNVQDVIDRAGVSRPTFYEHFSNKDDCFLAAFDTTAGRLRERVSAAAAAGEEWRERLRLGLEALLEFATDEHDAARTLVVEARAASVEVVHRRDALLEHFAACLDAQVREQVPEPPAHSAVTAAGIVGGIEALLYSRIYKGEPQDLAALLPSLMYFVVLPYGGHEMAGEELAVAVP